MGSGRTANQKGRELIKQINKHLDNQNDAEIQKSRQWIFKFRLHYGEDVHASVTADLRRAEARIDSYLKNINEAMIMETDRLRILAGIRKSQN